MLTNTDITIYHKYLNTATKLEEYKRQYFKKCWAFRSEETNVDKGYEKSNHIEIRIPCKENENWESAEIDIGDIIYVGKGPYGVSKQKDLPETYNVTKAVVNTFGNNTHIHIGGR